MMLLEDSAYFWQKGVKIKYSFDSLLDSGIVVSNFLLKSKFSFFSIGVSR